MVATGKGEIEGEVMVFFGKGRGKTAAALGVACRMIARGGKIIFVYFSGPQQPSLGEIKAVGTFGDNWRMIGIKSDAKDITFLDDFTELVDTTKEALALVQKRWLHECDLLVLNDISPHLARGGIDITELLAIIDNRPPNTTIILTGLSFPKLILQKADLITEFAKIK